MESLNQTQSAFVGGMLIRTPDTTQECEWQNTLSSLGALEFCHLSLIDPDYKKFPALLWLCFLDSEVFSVYLMPENWLLQTFGIQITRIPLILLELDLIHPLWTLPLLNNSQAVNWNFKGKSYAKFW